MYRKLGRIMMFLFALVVSIIIIMFQYDLIHPVKQDQPDVATLRSELPEVRHALVWPNNSPHSTGVGLPISHIRDLGENKSNVLVVIIVSTAPVRRERRDAIRQTWWRHCFANKVPCHFFTDGLVVDNKMQQNLLDEATRNKDMEFQPLMGGVEFGHRFLYQIQWAMANYNFQYFFRLDDDYFVCLQKLLHELPLRPKNSLVWGHFHCEVNLGWMDEAWMIFSHDIIETFLKQNASTMLCHPFAGQQIGLWLNDISQRLYFHDDRLKHLEDKSFDWEGANVCDKYIGVHRAYSTRMVQLNRASADGLKQVPQIPGFFGYCRYNTFDYKRMGSAFKFEPKPCIENPSWIENKPMWIGAEGKI